MNFFKKSIIALLILGTSVTSLASIGEKSLKSLVENTQEGAQEIVNFVKKKLDLDTDYAIEAELALKSAISSLDSNDLANLIKNDLKIRLLLNKKIDELNRDDFAELVTQLSLGANRYGTGLACTAKCVPEVLAKQGVKTVITPSTAKTIESLKNAPSQKVMFAKLQNMATNLKTLKIKLLKN